MATVKAPESESAKATTTPVHRGPPAYVPPRGLAVAYLVFWLALGGVLLVGSARTLLAALQGGHGPGHVQSALLAGLAMVGALLFLVPKSLRLGGVILLVTFGLALGTHQREHPIPGRLLLCVAATVFVVAHGPVPMAWLKARPPRGV
jgi:hypothetical protein